MGYAGAVIVEDAVFPTLIDLVDADYCVHGNEAALHAVEFGSELVLARVDDDFRLLAEDVVLNLDEAIQIARVDAVGVNLVDLTHAVEYDFVDVIFAAVAHYLARVLQLPYIGLVHKNPRARIIRDPV